MKFISGYKQLNDDTSPFSGKYVAKENVHAVGDVQSGKTKWIIETRKDFTDNGYKIIILFGGYTNILNDQSFDRCWQELRRTYPGIMLKKSISADDYKYLNMTNQEQPIVYTLLKSADNIKKIDETFLEGISDIKRYPILIIDDETDYASPNTKITNVSAVHKNFCKLIKTVQKGKIIQVTATPFSNILAKASDPYFPDRIICLKHNDEYCGLDKFLNDSNYKHLSYKKNEFLDNYIRESLACFAASCCFYD